MADRIKGIIVGDDDTLWKGLQAELSQLVEFVERYDDYSNAYTLIKDLQPEAVFIDVDIDSESGLALAKLLRNSMPASYVFLVSRKREAKIILEGLRTGVTDFFVFPCKDKQIRNAVSKALGRAATGGRSGEVTAVFSMKGGQGVTSIATNLTDHIHALTGDNVILMDMNLYMGDVSVFLEIPSTYTPFDMMKNLERIDENLLFSSLNRHQRGFYVLTAPDEVSDADQLVGENITRIIKLLKTYLGHIIIDIPHDFTEKSLAAIDAADTILLIVQQSMSVIKSVQTTLKFFEELGYDDKKVKIIVNRFMEKSELTREDISYVLNWPVFATIANDFASLTDAMNKSKTLDMIKPDLRINRDIRALAGLVTGIKSEAKDREGWLDVIGNYMPALKRILPA